MTECLLRPRPVPDSSVAERQQYLTIAVRDFLNEGGKLIHAGETAGYYGCSTTCSAGARRHLLRPRRRARSTVRRHFDPFSDCLLLADDFAQYYLGAYEPQASLAADRRRGHCRSDGR